MKRASTLDRHGRQAAVQYAGVAKVSTGKEETNVTADSEASSSSPLKKPKLSKGKEIVTVKNISHSKGKEHELASAVSPPRKEAADGEQITQSRAAALPSLHASMPVLRGPSSKLATTTRTEVPLPASVDMPVNGSPSHTQQDLLSPGTATGNRRQQWLEQNQHSFIFDEITDPLLLALFDTGAGVAASPPAATLPPLSEREHKQQFQPIANAIKKALEGILADVMRKFMTAAKRDGIPKPEFQEAHHAYSEMLQMFNRAKVAAVDGQEARMLAELRTICPAMEEFLRLRFKNVVQHFSAEKTEREAMKSGLRTLLAQCREWLHDDKEKAIRPWSPALAPSSPEARQRAVSSPAKPSEPMTQTESDRTERLSSSLSGHISPRSSQHRIGPYSPSAAATPSPTSTLLTSPLTSPVTSPVLNPKAVASPKESAKSFRISALIGSPLSPRSKDAGRKESPVKGHARQSLQNDSTSRSNLSAQHSEMPVTPEKATTE